MTDLDRLHEERALRLMRELRALPPAGQSLLPHYHYGPRWVGPPGQARLVDCTWWRNGEWRDTPSIQLRDWRAAVIPVDEVDIADVHLIVAAPGSPPYRRMRIADADGKTTSVWVRIDP